MRPRAFLDEELRTFFWGVYWQPFVSKFRYPEDSRDYSQASIYGESSLIFGNTVGAHNEGTTTVSYLRGVLSISSNLSVPQATIREWYEEQWDTFPSWYHKVIGTPDNWGSTHRLIPRHVTQCRGERVPLISNGRVLAYLTFSEAVRTRDYFVPQTLRGVVHRAEELGVTLLPYLVSFNTRVQANNGDLSSPCGVRGMRDRIGGLGPPSHISWVDVIQIQREQASNNDIPQRVGPIRLLEEECSALKDVGNKILDITEMFLVGKKKVPRRVLASRVGAITKNTPMLVRSAGPRGEISTELVVVDEKGGFQGVHEYSGEKIPFYTGERKIDRGGRVFPTQCPNLCAHRSLYPVQGGEYCTSCRLFLNHSRRRCAFSPTYYRGVPRWVECPYPCTVVLVGRMPCGASYKNLSYFGDSLYECRCYRPYGPSTYNRQKHGVVITKEGHALFWRSTPPGMDNYVVGSTNLYGGSGKTTSFQEWANSNVDNELNFRHTPKSKMEEGYADVGAKVNFEEGTPFIPVWLGEVPPWETDRYKRYLEIALTRKKALTLAACLGRKVNKEATK